MKELELNGKQYTATQDDKGVITLTPVMEAPKDKDWFPKKGENCTILDSGGIPISCKWGTGPVPVGLVNNYNFYRTEEEAEKASKYVRTCNAIIRACLLVDPNYEPDLNDLVTTKYFVFYHTRSSSWKVDRAHCVQMSPVHVSTRGKAEEVCALLTKWGVKP